MTSVSTENSTTVRSYRFGVPPVLRATVRAVDRVAPDLTARLALRLWCRPPHHKDRRPLPGGTTWTLPFGPSEIAGQTWGDGPTVVLVHGWGGNRAQLAATFVEPLVAAGLRVVAYDAPSHGVSGPGALGRNQAHARRAGVGARRRGDRAGGRARAGPRRRRALARRRRERARRPRRHRDRAARAPHPARPALVLRDRVRRRPRARRHQPAPARRADGGARRPPAVHPRRARAGRERARPAAAGPRPERPGRQGGRPRGRPAHRARLARVPSSWSATASGTGGSCGTRRRSSGSSRT